MSLLFTPYNLGPLTLKNRIIRSSAFENMAYNNAPSDDLRNYHVACARGGVAMTTLAYCSVNRRGVSFNGQLYVHDEIVPAMKQMVDDIHEAGAKVSIQMGHCGNMTHPWTCGGMPVGASTGFNLYSPTIHKRLSKREIQETVRQFGEAVDWARRCGIDCVEIHAGHGYLISQFLSPYTNHRHDEYGGSFENRTRFMRECLTEVMRHAGNDMAVVVKTNMYDGFKAGLQLDECIRVAQEIEKCGVHAIVTTAGFVSKAPFSCMGGAMPIKALTHYMNPWTFGWLKVAVRLFGKLMIPTVPFRELFFLEDAKRFQAALHIPVIYVGGIMSRQNCETVLQEGFPLMQVGHALVNDTDFVRHMQEDEQFHSKCRRSNYCVGRMYTLEMKCHQCMEALPKSLQREVDQLENEWYGIQDEKA